MIVVVSSGRGEPTPSAEVGVANHVTIFDEMAAAPDGFDVSRPRHSGGELDAAGGGSRR